MKINTNRDITSRKLTSISESFFFFSSEFIAALTSWIFKWTLSINICKWLAFPEGNYTFFIISVYFLGLEQIPEYCLRWCTSSSFVHYEPLVHLETFPLCLFFCMVISYPEFISWLVFPFFSMFVFFHCHLLSRIYILACVSLFFILCLTLILSLLSVLLENSRDQVLS